MRLALIVCLINSTATAQFAFRTNDVIAFLGGTDVVTAQQSGHLETLLTVHHPSLNLRFRNFGWEADTVFAQPRDINFPPLEEHLRRAGATVVVFEYGRAEALEARPAREFAAAYSKFISRFTNQTSRFLLVIPAPFERPSGLLPDLTKRNAFLAADYARGIRELGYPTIDLSHLSGPFQNPRIYPRVRVRLYWKLSEPTRRRYGREAPSDLSPRTLSSASC